MIYEVTVDHADNPRCLGFLVHDYVGDDAPEDLAEFYHTLAREGYALTSSPPKHRSVLGGAPRKEIGGCSTHTQKHLYGTVETWCMDAPRTG